MENVIIPTFILGPLQTQWIKSLRENPDRQGRGALGEKYTEDSYKACCLGEAALICGIGKWTNSSDQLFVEYITHEDTPTKSYNFLSGDTYKAMGLYEQAGNPNEELMGELPLKSLVNLNDNGTPWPEIADILEKYAYYYFTHPV